MAQAPLPPMPCVLPSDVDPDPHFSTTSPQAWRSRTPPEPDPPGPPLDPGPGRGRDKSTTTYYYVLLRTTTYYYVLLRLGGVWNLERHVLNLESVDSGKTHTKCSPSGAAMTPWSSDAIVPFYKPKPVDCAMCPPGHGGLSEHYALKHLLMAGQHRSLLA